MDVWLSTMNIGSPTCGSTPINEADPAPIVTMPTATSSSRAESELLNGGIVCGWAMAAYLARPRIDARGPQGVPARAPF